MRDRSKGIGGAMPTTEVLRDRQLPIPLLAGGHRKWNECTEHSDPTDHSTKTSQWLSAYPYNYEFSFSLNSLLR